MKPMKALQKRISLKFAATMAHSAPNWPWKVIIAPKKALNCVPVGLCAVTPNATGLKMKSPLWPFPTLNATGSCKVLISGK